MNKRIKKKAQKNLVAKNMATFFQTIMFGDYTDWIEQQQLTNALFGKDYDFVIDNVNAWLAGECRVNKGFEAAFTANDLTRDASWCYPNGHFVRRLRKRELMTVANSDLAIWWQSYYNVGRLRPLMNWSPYDEY